MSRKSEASKEFLGNWYIIGAAKDWLGLHVTFNMCDEIRAAFYAKERPVDMSVEQHFENVLIEYNEERQEETD